MIIKNSTLIAKKTQAIIVTRTNFLKVFEEIVAVHSEKHMKQFHKICGKKHGIID